MSIKVGQSNLTISAPNSEAPESIKTEDGSVKVIEPSLHIPKNPRHVQTPKRLIQRNISPNSLKTLYLKVVGKPASETPETEKSSTTKEAGLHFRNISQDLDRKSLTQDLIQQWTGKDLQTFSKAQIKAIDNLNSFSMTALSRLLKEDNQLTVCQLPNCLIRSNSDSLFSQKASYLLERTLIKHPDLERIIGKSDGLFKTPILIAVLPKSPVMAPEDMYSVNLSDTSSKKTNVFFYPRVDTKDTAPSSITTLYIEGNMTSHYDELIDNFASALKRAVVRAEASLPNDSKETVKQLRH